MLCDLTIEGGTIAICVYFWCPFGFLGSLLGYFRGSFGVLGVLFRTFWVSFWLLLGSPGRSGPAEGFGPVSGCPQDAQKVALHADLGHPKVLIFRKRRGREEKTRPPKCTFSGRSKSDEKVLFLTKKVRKHRNTYKTHHSGSVRASKYFL